MKRVLQVTGLLGGILLVVIAANLMGRRDNHDSTDIFLMTAQRQGHDSVYLVGANDNHLAWRSLGPSYLGLTPKGMSSNGEWVYLGESDYYRQGSIPYGELARVRRDGSDFQRLKGVIANGPTYESPDGQWLYYVHYDATTYRNDLYRARTDGSTTENLTGNLPFSANLNDYDGVPVIDPAGTWIIFVGYDANYQGSIYRLGLTNGSLENLNPTITGYIGLMGATADRNWLVVKLDDQLYRMQLDGTDLTHLFGQTVGLTTLLPPSDMLLTSVYQPDGSQTYYGLDVSDGQIYWKLDHMQFDYSLGGSQRLLRSMDNWLYVIEPNHQPPRSLIHVPPNIMNIVLSPDRAWLVMVYYLLGDATQPLTYYINRIHLSDGLTTVLFKSTASPSLVGWQDDGSAFYVETYDTSGRDLWRVGLTDQTKHRMLHHQSYGYFLGLAGERDWHGRVVLPVLGLAIIGGVVGRQLTRVKTRMSANSQRGVK